MKNDLKVISNLKIMRDYLKEVKGKIKVEELDFFINKLNELDIKDIRNIHFDFDQYKLDEDAQEDVQFDSDIIQALAAPIIIEGNADSRGSDEYNYALGLKRAEEVKQALIIDGVKNELKVISYGESAPICTETTEDCLAKNRRVQFKTETK